MRFVRQMDYFRKKFSKIGMDHNHEQQNAKIKGVGGVIDISEYENALQHWLLSGPEVARLLEEFEAVGDVDASKVLEHYESDPSYQMRFLKDVKLVSSAIDERGNPFMDDSLNLYNLYNKELVGLWLSKHCTALKKSEKSNLKSILKIASADDRLQSLKQFLLLLLSSLPAFP